MKLNKKTIAIIIVGIVVVAGAIFAGLFFFTDMFKSPQELFFKYVGSAAMPETDYSYQQLLDEMQIANTKSYKANYTVGINGKVRSNSYSYRNQKQALDELSKMKINVGINSIPSEEKASYNIGLNYDGKEIASGEIVKNNDLYGVKSELLDEKYIAIKNDKLKEFANKLGIDSSYIPDKISTLDLYKLLYISKEDQDHIINTYKDALLNSFSKENFSKADNVVTTVNNVSKNTTTYTLSVSQKDFYNAIKNILQTAKNDDRTLNMLAEKINTVTNDSFLVKMGLMSYYENSKSYNRSTLTEMPEIPKITANDIKKAIEEMISDFEYELRYADSSEKIDMVVYVENGKTAKIELKQGNTVGAAIEFYEENGEKHMVLYGLSSSYNSRTYSYDRKLAKLMDVQYQVTKNGNYKKTNASMKVYDTYEEEQGRIYLETVTDGKPGEGTNKNSIKYTIETEDMSLGIDVDGTIEYTNDVKVNTLSKENANILNDMSLNDIQALANKISNTVQNKGTKLIEEIEEIFTSKSYIPRTITPSSILDF